MQGRGSHSAEWCGRLQQRSAAAAMRLSSRGCTATGSCVVLIFCYLNLLCFCVTDFVAFFLSFFAGFCGALSCHESVQSPHKQRDYDAGLLCFEGEDTASDVLSYSHYTYAHPTHFPMTLFPIMTHLPCCATSNKKNHSFARSGGKYRHLHSHFTQRRLCRPFRYGECGDSSQCTGSSRLHFGVCL